MQKLKRLALNTGLASFLLLFTASVPAYALMPDQGVTAPTAQSSSSQTSSDAKQAAKEQLREKAEADLAAKKQALKDKASKNQAERQQRCEAHKDDLNKRFANIGANSQKIQDRIDNIFVKVKSYKENKNLDVTDYDTLVATAASAQSDSQTAINTLKSLTPTIDCSHSNTASDVSAYKQAAIDVRSKLKTYRDSVKDLIKAVKAAKPVEGVDQ